MLKKNSFVLNKNDHSTTYMITTDTLQTRNRRQVRSTQVRSHINTRVAESHLVPLSEDEAIITMAAEQIIRNKKAMTAQEKSIVSMARSIKENYL